MKILQACCSWKEQKVRNSDKRKKGVFEEGDLHRCPRGDDKSRESAGERVTVRKAGHYKDEATNRVALKRKTLVISRRSPRRRLKIVQLERTVYFQAYSNIVVDG